MPTGGLRAAAYDGDVEEVLKLIAARANIEEKDEVRKVDVRLPGKGNSNSHGARPVHLIISMIKWIRTSRLSIKSSLSQLCLTRVDRLF